MKTGFLIVALTVGLLAGAMTGASLAGDESNAGLVNLYSADPERALVDTWQIQVAIETGAFPEKSKGANRSGTIASNDEGFSFIEAGGVRYRVGLDAGS